MSLILLLLRGFNLFFVFIIGVAVYALCIFLLKVLNIPELLLIIGILSRRSSNEVDPS